VCRKHKDAPQVDSIMPSFKYQVSALVRTKKTLPTTREIAEHSTRFVLLPFTALIFAN